MKPTISKTTFTKTQKNTTNTTNTTNPNSLSLQKPKSLTTTTTNKNISIQNKGQVTTIIGKHKDLNDPSKEVVSKFTVSKTSQADNSEFDWENRPLPTTKKDKEMMDIEQKMSKDLILDNLKRNKVSKGTQIMMDNEVVHAKEAIECGIYVNWTSKNSKGETVYCFRLGSNSMCICGHGFLNHEKTVTKKKFSAKCLDCKCKAFSFIPLYPEEIGEYWMPYQKTFSYSVWKGKCKCGHTWVDHKSESFLSCKQCNCFGFNSNFCCVVCNKFWQDHENTYELEHERYMNKLPIGEDYIPFSEMPDMYEAVYKNSKFNK